MLNPFEPFIKSSLTYDEPNLSTRQELELFFPFPFSSPWEAGDHELPLNQIFSQRIISGNKVRQDFSEKNESDGVSNPVVKPEKVERNLGAVPRKRTGKKDRHSKICTAQGIRDRRMRLSLQVARKFFDLQDMLGYDKASKTIEWLFNKSKKAIKELEKDHQSQQLKNSSINDHKKNGSFVSDQCELLSGMENLNSELSAGSVKQDSQNLVPNTPSITRVSREKARARARERTREKMLIKRVRDSKLWYKQNPKFEAIEESTDLRHFEAYALDYQPLNHAGTNGNFLGAENTIFDYDQCYTSISCCIDSNNNYMGFLGNWQMTNTDGINPENRETARGISFAGINNSLY